MSIVEKKELDSIQFYVTTKYACGYIPNQSAQSIVATPYKQVNNTAYDELIKKGFRRSGQYIYKPRCSKCNSCIPIRINVNNFKNSKSQKRVRKKNRDLTFRILPLNFNEEHFELYLKYQRARHAAGVTNSDDIADYNDFLIKSNVSTKILEFRDSMGVLKIISIVDFLNDGLSAVYTFYDTESKSNSYGTHSILCLIQLCLREKLKYLYLGYWINDCQKMAYKINFREYELMINGVWQASSS